MSTNQALLEKTLYAIADADIDITPLFFERFFARYPQHKVNFYHPEETCGPMVNEMVENLIAIAQGESWVPNNIQNLIIAHRDFGAIEEDMYPDAIDILIDTLAEASAPRWDLLQDAAWREQATKLSALVRQYY